MVLVKVLDFDTAIEANFSAFDCHIVLDHLECHLTIAVDCLCITRGKVAVLLLVGNAVVYDFDSKREFHFCLFSFVIIHLGTHQGWQKIFIFYMAYEWWSVCTNALSLLPVFKFFKDKYYVDAVYVLMTAIASVLYHLTFDIQDFDNGDIDPKAIHQTDFILSDMLIYMIPSWIIWKRNYEVRFALFVSMVPIQTYTLWDNDIMRTQLYLLYAGPTMAYVIYHHWRNKWFILGFLISLTELLMYFEFANRHDEYHHLYHGFHHVCAFLSIYVYQFIHKDKYISFADDRYIQDDE